MHSFMPFQLFFSLLITLPTNHLCNCNFPISIPFTQHNSALVYSLDSEPTLIGFIFIFSVPQISNGANAFYEIFSQSVKHISIISNVISKMRHPPAGQL